MSETHLSAEAKARLEAELEDLKTVGRTKIAQAIELARELGDLSENADYHAAKDEQGRMEGRIRQLEALLKNAQTVTDDGPADEVRPGSMVSLRYEGDDDVEVYYLGSLEERREDVQIASTNSPLGQALIGRRKGETVEYTTPTGATVKVEIADVTR